MEPNDIFCIIVSTVSLFTTWYIFCFKSVPYDLEDEDSLNKTSRIWTWDLNIWKYLVFSCLVLIFYIGIISLLMILAHKQNPDLSTSLFGLSVMFLSVLLTSIVFVISKYTDRKISHRHVAYIVTMMFMLCLIGLVSRYSTTILQSPHVYEESNYTFRDKLYDTASSLDDKLTSLKENVIPKATGVYKDIVGDLKNVATSFKNNDLKNIPSSFKNNPLYKGVPF